MRWLYNTAIKAYGTGIQTASFFHPKARQWVKGRSQWRERLEDALKPSKQWLWFHAASLGEAEQGLPLMEGLKKLYPEKRILLTFFSPSGYEHFPPHPAVDRTFYLPLDTVRASRDFVEILRPELAVFIKYEVWLNFFRALQRTEVPTVLAPALFRSDQFYFKAPMNSVFLPVLRKLNHILVQNQASKEVLETHGFANVTVCGDTRADRVLDLARSSFSDPLIARFCQDHYILILGSSWPEEEKILADLLTEAPDTMRFIMAPHLINPEHLQSIERLIGAHRCEWYSSGRLQGQRSVLVLDTIGLLSRTYRYAHSALIGGGFGRGVHNTLEAAAYGLPVFFGPNHRDFVEPGEMIEKGFAFEITTIHKMKSLLFRMQEDHQWQEELSRKAKQYLSAKAGAVEVILEKLQQLLKKD